MKKRMGLMPFVAFVGLTFLFIQCQKSSHDLNINEITGQNERLGIDRDSEKVLGKPKKNTDTSSPPCEVSYVTNYVMDLDQDLDNWILELVNSFNGSTDVNEETTLFSISCGNSCSFAVRKMEILNYPDDGVFSDLIAIKFTADCDGTENCSLFDLKDCVKETGELCMHFLDDGRCFYDLGCSEADFDNLGGIQNYHYPNPNSESNDFNDVLSSMFNNAELELETCRY